MANRPIVFTGLEDSHDRNREMRRVYYFGENCFAHVVARQRDQDDDTPTDIPILPDEEPDPPPDKPPERAPHREDEPDPPPMKDPDPHEPVRFA